MHPPAVIGAETRKERKNARGRSGRASVAHRPQGKGLSARLCSQKHRLHFSVVEKSARFLNSTQFRCGFSTPKYIKTGCSKRFLRLLSPIFATITELCSFWSESFQHYLVTFQTLSTVSNSYYLHCGNVYLGFSAIFIPCPAAPNHHPTALSFTKTARSQKRTRGSKKRRITPFKHKTAIYTAPRAQ